MVVDKLHEVEVVCEDVGVCGVVFGGVEGDINGC